MAEVVRSVLGETAEQYKARQAKLRSAPTLGQILVAAAPEAAKRVADFVPGIGAGLAAKDALDADEPKRAAVEVVLGLLDAVPGGAGAKSVVSKLVFGKKARGAQLQKELVSDAVDSGFSAEGAKRAYGVHYGPDGQFRFEVDDSKAFTSEAVLERLGKSSLNAQPLDAVFEHPRLFKDYPDLKNVRVQVMELSDDTSAAYFPSSDRIVVSPQALKGGKAHEAMLHEIQHAIQKREGFIDGANMKEKITAATERLKKQGLTGAKLKDEAELQGWKDYLRDYGEAESRTVEMRRFWSKEERENLPFEKHVKQVLNAVDERKLPVEYPKPEFDITEVEGKDFISREQVEEYVKTIGDARGN